MPERTGPVPLKDCINELLLELIDRHHLDQLTDDGARQ